MKNYLIKAVLIVLVVEGVTLPPVILTMGHAGPEGPLAIFGWLGLLINFPGYVLAVALGSYESTFSLAIAVFVIQVLILVLLAVLVKLLFLDGKANPRR